MVVRWQNVDKAKHWKHSRCGISAKMSAELPQRGSLVPYLLIFGLLVIWKSFSLMERSVQTHVANEKTMAPLSLGKSTRSHVPKVTFRVTWPNRRVNQFNTSTRIRPAGTWQLCSAVTSCVQDSQKKSFHRDVCDIGNLPLVRAAVGVLANESLRCHSERTGSCSNVIEEHKASQVSHIVLRIRGWVRKKKDEKSHLYTLTNPPNDLKEESNHDRDISSKIFSIYIGRPFKFHPENTFPSP